MITVGELFAGIGGFSLAFHAAGARTAWFVEREPYCQKVLNKHWPDVPVYGDIYDCHELPHVDVITAGFPCQPFSVAGKQQGENDERYLVPEMLRVIAEVQPDVVLLENVPGFASLTDGNTFKQLLWALAEMGFDAQWGHLRASDVGAPHQRERWFCVAYAKKGRRRWRASSGNRRSNIRPIGCDQIMVNATGANGKTRPTDQMGESQSSTRFARADMGHAPSRRSQGQRPTWQQKPASHGRSPVFGRAGRHSRNRGVESGFRRDVDGLSNWLDRPRWPARPSQPQHAWEPPRVVSAQAHRTARLKALGNAVVPQVVYPLACAIVEYLEGEAADEKTA